MDEVPTRVAHRCETTLHENGRVTLDDIPFQKGDRLEIVISEKPAMKKRKTAKYPLRGQPFKLIDPFEPTN